MDQSWRRVVVESLEAPSPRTFHKAVLHNNNMYIIGGFDGEKLNDIWKINLKDVCYHSWSAKPKERSESALPTPPGPLPTDLFTKKPPAPLVYPPPSDFLGSLTQTLPPHTWTPIPYSLTSPHVPIPRTGHSISIFSNKLYIIGGMDPSSEVIPLSSLSILDLGTGAWSTTPTSGDIPLPRSGMQRPKGISDSLDYEGGRFISLFGGYTKANVILKVNLTFALDWGNSQFFSRENNFG